jgi:mono/diheme cytochrome c family protein
LGALALLLLGRVSGATPSAVLDGSWVGDATLGHRARAMNASATLGHAGARVSGTVALTGSGVAETFAVTGTTKGKQARLKGAFGSKRILWTARWSSAQQAWRGRLRVRDTRRTASGKLTFKRGRGGPAIGCGADLFNAELMPHVFEPICGQCHVPGGLAQSTRLRVTIGDPSATAASALGLVDVTNPTQSPLVLKPRAELAHGGGQRIVPGSAEDEALLQWIALVTAPGCDGAGGGGGGRTGDLYLDNCASCHGADARGLNGNPDIHCSRSIHDVVRSGRKGPTGEMPAFPSLTDADIGTIQALLLGLCPATGVTGADLFAGNCASCHGGDATGTQSAPSVRCATRVADAVRTGRGTAMPSLSALSDTEVGLLQGYLGELCTQAGRTGADIFAGNCATCHGADALGGQNGLGIVGADIRCNRAIHDPVRDGNDTMPAFPGLSDADIASMQQYLARSACPAGATGADLFASNCKSCHGTDARGIGTAPSVRCNRGIGDAVRNGRTGAAGTMPAFTGMPDAEVALVQSYLLTLCPPGSASGGDLFASNCAICHGTDAGGDAGTPSIRCATRVADAVQVGRGARMPSFPALLGIDLTSVTGFLDQLCTQAGRTGAELYAGNCATCHGMTANGGRNGLGVRGEEIRCTGAAEYQDKCRNGDGGMPRFPALSTGDVTAIVDFVHGTYCPGG